MQPRDLAIADYTYVLPEDRIAKYPLKDRDVSRLLIYKNGKIEEDIYRNIATYIPSRSLMIFNNTKVVEARLLFQKPTGGAIEIFCLEPGEQYHDITNAMLQTGSVFWKCLVGGASKWKHGQVLEKKFTTPGTGEIILQGRYIEKKSDHFIIELKWTPPHLSFAELLHAAGAIPLPPYIKRDVEPADKERYQTVYAQYDGSVAAPTAGLHFTENIFRDLDEKQVTREFITLHVGAGTFKPVKSERMEYHQMHAEFIEVSLENIDHIISGLSHSIIAVGTTSLRTLESLYWFGLKALEGSLEIFKENVPLLSQWEPYEMSKRNISPQVALAGLKTWMIENGKEKFIGRTQVLIAPSYKVRIANALITNFHQPQSTLLLLVAAIVGKNWKSLYDHALQNNFRFLSYGDGNLIWIDQP
jgi:S-adenosylmethionine:tRNA ribosyltransferase-isomerase